MERWVTEKKDGKDGEDVKGWMRDKREIGCIGRGRRVEDRGWKRDRKHGKNKGRKENKGGYTRESLDCLIIC